MIISEPLDTADPAETQESKPAKPNDPRRYVLGFLFDYSLSRVVLIRKETGPRIMRGKLNGIGGSVKPGETIYAAMIREFKEETGHDYYKDQGLNWSHYGTLLHIDDHQVLSNVALFAANSSIALVDGLKKRTVEGEVKSYPARYSQLENPMANLSYLIAAAKVHLNGDSRCHVEFRDMY